MWFKKKSVLLADGNYDTEKSADRTTDMRTTEKTYGNYSSSITNSGLPSAADAGNYFYLPALGFYNYGLLYLVGERGRYWSSSAFPWNNSSVGAYNLSLYRGYVGVGNAGDRYNGFRVGKFE